jgi:hypothetical protein
MTSDGDIEGGDHRVPHTSLKNKHLLLNKITYQEMQTRESITRCRQEKVSGYAHKRKYHEMQTTESIRICRQKKVYRDADKKKYQ